MRLLPLLALLVLSLAIVGCQDGSKTNDKKASEKFSDLGKDEEFKDAHKEPKELTNKEIKGQKIKFPTEGEQGIAYEVKSTDESNAYLYVIHEWWGLNDHILREADRLHSALEGKVNVMAIDLYDGKVTDKRDEAGKLMRAATPERCKEILSGALNYAGEGKKVGTIGWCFGGGWSLQTGILAGDEGVASIIYYGMPEENAKNLLPLKADVMGIFATKDKWITPEVDKKFGDLMRATGKSYVSHSFEADHAFANPSSDNYDEPSAKEANELALAFLKQRLL